MKTNSNNNLQEVIFALSDDSLLALLHGESSYIASSLYAAMTEKGDVSAMIITEDDREWVTSVLSQAFNFIVTTLTAYTTDNTKIENDSYTIELLLPATRQSGIDSLIRHEIERAFVTYALAIWYEFRIPEVAQRHAKSFTASLSSLKHDVYMAHRKCRRPSNYT